MSQKRQRAGKKSATQAAATTKRRVDPRETAAMIEAMASLRVGDLAAMMSPTDAEMDSIIERIRHWTRSGVLDPLDTEELAAPGKHRRYGDSAPYMAVVLNVMADIGLPVPRSRFLSLAMKVVREEEARWVEGGKKTPPLPLIIGMTRKKAIQVRAGELKDAAGFKAADAVLKIEIDLARLFTEVDRGRPQT
jgi:hypothetical protein